jgi:ricin-type beta-trefoil lectin protein
MQITNGQAYRITTSWSSLALDVRDSSTDNDAPVVQNPVNLPNTSQGWVVYEHPNNQWELVNVNSDKSLSAYYGKSDAGTPLVQYDRHGWNDQLWTIDVINEDDGNWTAFITTVLTFQPLTVVDVPGATIAWDTQLELWPRKVQIAMPGVPATANQQFRFTPVNVGAGFLS